MLGNVRELWITTRPPAGLLGGMAQFPTTDWSARSDGATDADAAPFEAAWVRTGEIQHGFTHFEIVLDVYAAEANQVHGEGRWADPDALEALPTLFRKALAIAF